ncbi:hypothetical protein ACFJGX_23060 [Hydrogenophaga sp. UC242_50]|uniref:hypothetical protein n=1 Tax=unclassified Hydrogenophaga TaxID=2610897 RepID=UPI0036D35F9B
MRTRLRRAAAPTLSLTPSTSRKILGFTAKASKQMAMLSDMMMAYRIAERHAALCAASKKPEDATQTITRKDVAVLLHALNGQMQTQIHRVSNTLSDLAAQVADATEDPATRASSGPGGPNP